MGAANRQYSTGENLEKLYVKVFEQLYPHIESREQGVLPSVIYIILGSEVTHGDEICRYLNIKNRVPLDDEISISTDIFSLFISNPNDKKQQSAFGNIIASAKEFMKDGTNKFRKSASGFEDHDMKLFQIVVIGCFIVGTLACIRYIQTSTKVRDKGEEADDNQVLDSSPQKSLEPVKLCLIVRASVIEDVREGDTISRSKVEELIDECLYFLCVKTHAVSMIEKNLELTDESVLAISEQREVYIRIEVPDGDAMIGKKIPYILKRGLPSTEENIIEELACIKYLSVSGLEVFNHV